VDNILALRNQSEHAQSQRPLFVWEPVPDLCVAQELPNCLQALKVVDCVSPNHAELGGFFARDTNGKDHVNYRLIEELCDQWLESGIGPDGKGGVVVRAGKDGCLVARAGSRKWLPAYHQRAENVVDPTGGGNGFLGGLAVGLVRGSKTSGVENIEEAALWGAISASFAIEQVGMPMLSRSSQGEETWNGVRVADRLSIFKERVGRYVQP
jgi:sugar/nucleoside kinase (ribokinase family)